MGPFKFRLATLLRLREQIRDERRAYLAEAEELEARLREQEAAWERDVAGVRAEIRRTAGPGRLNVDRLIDSGRYELLLRAQIAGLQPQLAAVAKEIETRRQALVEADRQVRVLEKLREQQELRHREAEEADERKVLDEVALLGWRGREDD